MHQTIYIDTDEEITSILDRIRQETTINIFLVVPKGSMLLNSIINLKLLKKEAQKMGKEVAIVAPNDNRAKVMIERAGIKAEDYNKVMNEQQLQAAALNKPAGAESITRAVEDSVDETRQQINQGGLDIGSNSFFSRGKNTQPLNAPIEESNRNEEQYRENSISQNSTVITPSKTITYQGDEVRRGFVNHSNNNFQDGSEENGYQQLPSQDINNNSELNNKFDYFKKTKKTKNKKEYGIFKYKFLLGILGAVILSALAGGGWYLANYPKLTIAIKPLSKNIDKEIKIVAKNDIEDINIDDKIIPGEYMEIPLKKEMEFEATGNKVIDKNGAKAKGTVTIENSFSDKPQKLVKTTRILSKDGKLFRLAKGVIVPGMTDNKPGKIEVPVEADKPGKDFNIDKGEFVIVAWKGTPKGDKFKVYSNSSMSGGITSADSKSQKVVSKGDLDLARKKTLEALDKSLKSEIEKRLNPGQKIVESSIEKEIVSSKASHLADTIADKFSYTVIYKVKLIAFNEEAVRKVVEGVIQEEIGKKYQLEKDFKIEAKRGVVDLDKKILTIYVDVEGIAVFNIDKELIKKSVAGKNSEDTKQALNKEVGVQSAEIKPSPSWSSKAPNNLDKITIEIVK